MYYYYYPFHSQSAAALALTLDIISYISKSIGGQISILWNRERAQRTQSVSCQTCGMQVWREDTKWDLAGRNRVGIWREKELHVANHKLRLVSNHENIDEVSAKLRKNRKKSEK